MARKKREEEHENHERWLVSYADFITLLFAFFVVMYAVSRVDNKRLTQVANAMRWALHFEGTGGVRAIPIFDGPPSEGGCVASPGNAPKATPKQVKAAEVMRAALEKRMQALLSEEAGIVSLLADGDRVVVRLGASRFFDPSAATLRPEVLPLLDAVASELAGLNRPIRIEAHTDGSPVASPRFRNNWELSAARAATVTGYLQDAHRVPPNLLAAVGYGSTRPIASDETTDGREINRRLELSVQLAPDESGSELPIQ